MIEISPEKDNVRHADRGKRRAQITQPYGTLLPPLLLPSCLSLQEEEDHLQSPPLTFPIYIYTLCNLSYPEPFSFSSVFSLVIQVFLLFWFVCLLPSQPKLTGWVHIPLRSLSAVAAAIKAPLMATSPCLTSASHSGQLMTTLLTLSVLYIYFCLSTIPPSLHPLHPLVFTSPTPNLSNCNTSYKMLLSAQ